MHARQHDLRVPLREHSCFLDQLGNRARAVRAPGDGRRAEGAVLVAAVLDLEEPAGPPHRPPSPPVVLTPWPPLPPGEGERKACSAKHLGWLRPSHHGTHARQRRDRAIVPSRGAAYHHGLEAFALPSEPAHQAPQLRLALVRDRARVHHREVRRRGVVHHRRPPVGERLLHQGRVVLVRLAAERMEVDVHGRPVIPTSPVHTRSVSPAPRRSSRSTPTSSSARPWANARPVPAAAPNSVAAVVPGPNGSWPPRTPNRNGVRPPAISAPADQVQVSNAPGPVRAQPRHATDPPNRTLGLGENSIPPPAIRGRSVSALVVSATVARNRLSMRAQPITLSPGATPSNRLPDTPTPE